MRQRHQERNSVIAVAELLTVLVLSAVALWSAIPLGLAMGLKPVAILGVAATGNITSVVCVTLVGEQVRAWLLERIAHKTSRRDSALWRIWDRYGVVGIALLSPWMIGAPVAAAFGMALGIPARRLLGWMLPSVVLRVVVFTVSATLGWLGLQQILFG
jgi:hypothetical protein